MIRITDEPHLFADIGELVEELCGVDDVLVEERQRGLVLQSRNLGNKHRAKHTAGQDNALAPYTTPGMSVLELGKQALVYPIQIRK